MNNHHTSKNFALTGVAGYIAPRHLKAIQDTGNNLVAALDPHDSVGILDSFFPDTAFFTEFERFDRHLEKLRREDKGKEIDYLTICSPNYLHDAHIRLALRLGAHAICEKPIVLNPWNIEALKELESESNKKIYTVLQLRLHPKLIELKEKLKNNGGKKRDVVLTYITSRGSWYLHSWKGQLQKSGGLATNIGIHFFDMLMWLFGPVKNNITYVRDENKNSGYLELENARVQWYLSIDVDDIPPEIKKAGQRTFRSITIDGTELEFSTGFTDLHTEVYKDIFSGKGFGLDDAKPSIEVAHTIRNNTLSKPDGNTHPFVKY